MTLPYRINLNIFHNVQSSPKMHSPNFGQLSLTCWSLLTHCMSHSKLATSQCTEMSMSSSRWPVKRKQNGTLHVQQPEQLVC